MDNYIFGFLIVLENKLLGWFVEYVEEDFDYMEVLIDNVGGMLSDV